MTAQDLRWYAADSEKLLRYLRFEEPAAIRAAIAEPKMVVERAAQLAEQVRNLQAGLVVAEQHKAQHELQEWMKTYRAALTGLCGGADYPNTSIHTTHMWAVQQTEAAHGPKPEPKP